MVNGANVDYKLNMNATIIILIITNSMNYMIMNFILAIKLSIIGLNFELNLPKKNLDAKIFYL